MTYNELQEVKTAVYAVCREGVSRDVATKGLNKKQLVLFEWSIV